MNGFQREIRGRILSVSSHATMMGLEGNLANWQTVQREVLKQPGVVAAAPYIEQQALLANARIRWSGRARRSSRTGEDGGWSLATRDRGEIYRSEGR